MNSIETNYSRLIKYIIDQLISKQPRAQKQATIWALNHILDISVCGWRLISKSIDWRAFIFPSWSRRKVTSTGSFESLCQNLSELLLYTTLSVLYCTVLYCTVLRTVHVYCTVLYKYWADGCNLFHFTPNSLEAFSIQ